MKDAHDDDLRLAATGGEFGFAAARGAWLALYFYPKDNTPGCSVQAQQFRDLHARFAAAGCKVYGVSRDSLKSHEKFKAKLALPFELIADTDEVLCRRYDTVRLKKLYGKEYRGIERSIFLFDATGVLRREWRGVKADGSAQEILDFLEKIAVNE
ncbi:MAG TPA: peroxiredoxin [Rhodocyclaceae bacterium]|nr:peroxiredoxin [Rhodocyclaceae bacterium]